MSAALKDIEVENLQPHPDNPRLVLREDVVDSIASQVKDGGFSQMHALIVRPVNGHYEILSGHHRVEAAKRAKLKVVPCWISDMGDEEAFMTLVLSNAQSELSPLEIGVHALKAVPLGKRGRGNTGDGSRGYAKRIGKTERYVGQVRAAAEVLEAVKAEVDFSLLLDKAQHLSAIHSADPTLWPLLVQTMLDKGWSAADTEHWVKAVNEFDVPDRWRETFLPLDLVVQRFLDTHEFAPSTVKKLCALADVIVKKIEAKASDRELHEKHIAEFMAWLAENRGGKAWDAREFNAYERRLDVELDREAVELQKCWNLGDFHNHIGGLADGSVALLLTDPPYGIDYQSDHRLDRRKERKNAKIANDSEVSALDTLRDALTLIYPKLADNSHVLIFCHWSNEPQIRALIEIDGGYQIRGSLVWVKNNTGMGDPSTTFAPKHERIIHAVKGSPVLFNRAPDVLTADRVSSGRHPTEKPVDLLKTLIEATTVEGEMVVDPFGGVASTLVAARQSGRAYWGCEVDAEYHRAGADRLMGDQ